ncbi:MAG: hypothetical protein EOP62_11635 [Sphingomonadales bacterium]|nr:MAG: hypothetical protein EOP62_11635 [Sphingomonadales bacterium]
MHNEEHALEMIRHMLRWTMDGALNWEVTPKTLRTNNYGDIAWTAQPALGGPVTITHRVYSLFTTDLTELAEAADALFECAKEVERHSRERANYEQDMRRVAKTLLRRKAAAGITLVDVVSDPIPTDYYQDIGVAVTFAWAEGPGSRVTFEVGNADDLKEAFDGLVADLGRVGYPLAA